MAKIFAARGAQYTKCSEFVANYNDTMVSTAGNLSTFGSVYTDNLIFDVINLPVGAVISHGEVIIDTAYTGTTAATIKVGNSTTDDLYLASTTMMSVTAGTKYPFTTNVSVNDTAGRPVSAIGAQAGLNVRITLTHTVANATAGKFRVRVYWTLEGQVNETYPI